MTPEQSTAAHSEARRLIVTAGAGAGKTRVLAARCAAVADPASPVPGRKARAVTFTRAGAAELQARAPGTKCTTLHGLAIEIRRMMSTIPFSVYDDVDARDVAILAGQETRLLPAEIKDPWRAAKKALADGQASAEYRRILRSAYAFDYDGIIEAALADAPMVRQHFADVHLLCDEAQDNDGRQFTLIHRLNPSAVTLVGDVRQSIYGFRGADPEQLESMIAGAPDNGWTSLALTANFRSLPPIVEAANRIASKMDFETAPMVAMRSEDEPYLAQLLGYPTDTASEAAGTARLLRHHIAAWRPGDPPAAFVLARRWSDLEQTAAELTRLGVPFAGKPGATWKDDPACRELLRGLSLTVNPRQDHWTRMLARTRMGAVELAEAVAGAAAERLPLLTRLAGCAYWAHTLAVQERSTPSKALSLVGFALDIGETPMTTALYGVALAWEQTAEDPSPRAFLDDLRDMDASTAVNAPVLLSTIHGAKGLEAPLVCVVGCDREGLPAHKPEDRRLAYVAATRARDLLVMTAPRTRKGRNGRMMPSVFLDELAQLPAEVSEDDIPY